MCLRPAWSTKRVQDSQGITEGPCIKQSTRHAFIRSRSPPEPACPLSLLTRLTGRVTLSGFPPAKGAESSETGNENLTSPIFLPFLPTSL